MLSQIQAKSPPPGDTVTREVQSNNGQHIVGAAMRDSFLEFVFLIRRAPHDYQWWRFNRNIAKVTPKMIYFWYQKYIYGIKVSKIITITI